MKKLAIFCTAAMMTCVPLHGKAQAPPVKIGFVDLQRVMLESEKGKVAKKTLSDELEKLKKNLTQKQDELQKLKDTLDKQSALITQEARAEKEREYQTKLKDYQTLANDYQRDMQHQDREFTQKILKELDDVIKGIGDRDKYTLILERSQGAILFAPTTIDLTDKVISLYNEASKEASKKKAPPPKN
jgi:outer membrane protein